MSLEHPVRRILCATDFSPSSDVALDWAAALAKREGAELHVVHAWQLPELVSPAGGIIPMPEVSAEIHREIEAGLKKACEGRTVASQTIRRGMPDTEIAGLARDLGVDVVVVGTHGRTGLSHVLLGSIAERVIRLSPVPVVTVPMTWGARARAETLVRRVLCPTDLTAASEASVAEVIAMAERLGAHVDLVHVLDLPPYALRHDEVLSEIERSVTRDLADLAERHRTRAVALKTHVRTGVAADAIVSVATEIDADLIALPTHARRGVARFFLGSVAERVARTAARPVLTLRQTDAKA